MNIEKASENELNAPKFDRRKNNPGRKPLIDISAWEVGDKLDLSRYLGLESMLVARSARNQSKARGWTIREIEWNVFVRLS
jgi:hypothetical protein